MGVPAGRYPCGECAPTLPWWTFHIDAATPHFEYAGLPPSPPSHNGERHGDKRGPRVRPSYFRSSAPVIVFRHRPVLREVIRSIANDGSGTERMNDCIRRNYPDSPGRCPPSGSTIDLPGLTCHGPAALGRKAEITCDGSTLSVGNVSYGSVPVRPSIYVH